MRKEFTQDILLKAIELYNNGLSLREIGKIIDFDHSNIRYNFNKNNIKLRNRSDAIKLSESKRDKTGQNNPNYKHGLSNRIDFKLNIIAYAGNKCVDCNIVASRENYSIFEFHHLDPKQKEYAIAESKNLKISINNIYKEIDKCVLLCANCHRLRHQNEN